MAIEILEKVFRPLNEVERRNAPKQIFWRGDPSLLQTKRRVALVGSRRVSDEGLKRTRRLTRLLVEEEIVVVSGLALGVDAAAHRTAIEHEGRTVAVLGSPLEIAYPSDHQDLQDEIGREHLLVSQFPSGHPVKRTNFPQRNRTMALLCDASVIVEAGESSGTLSQGWEALRLGRPLFIMKSVFDRDELIWPREMLDYGAFVLSEPDELLTALEPEPLNIAL